MKRILNRFTSGNLNKKGTSSIPLPPEFGFEEFVSSCLRVLNSTSAGTAIYILSCLCPEDFRVVLEVLRIDLSRPHSHKHYRKGHAASNFNADVISSMRAYAKTLSKDVYSHVWLEIVQRWLFTCPLDKKYYLPDETDEDCFCPKLRSELIDSILRLD